MYKVFIRFSYILIFSLLFSSCGLPSYQLVVEPTVNENYAPHVGFEAPADESNIDGYEVWYKIYESTSSAISTDEEAFETNSTDASYKYGDTLPMELGFVRLLKDDPVTSQVLTEYPLVSSNNVTGAFVLRIKIQTLSDNIETVNTGSEDAATGAATDVFGEAIRTVGLLEYKYFTDDVVSEDDDNNGVLISTNNYVVAFAAYSYVSGAQIITTFQDSYPVYLGRIELTQ